MPKRVTNSKLAPLIKDGDRLKYLLEECEYGNGFNFLTNDQWKELWDLFHVWLKGNAGSEDDPNTAVLEESLKFLSVTVKSDKITERIGNVVKVVNFFFNNQEMVSKAKQQSLLCKLGEKWMAQDLPAVADMDRYVFQHLLSATEIKRLIGLRRYFNPVLVLDSLSTINELVQNPKVMETEASQKLFGLLASQSPAVFNKLYSTVNLEMEKCTKKTAECYGNALMLTWQNAEATDKEQIGYKFQELMEDFLKRCRKALEMSKPAANILTAINVWYKEVRQKIDSEFITMITKCLQPILWKYLSCGRSFQRCNAADLFFKAFPLQLPDDPSADGVLFLEQIEVMEQLLRDDCHIIRIIAVREVCNILAAYWPLFSDSQINRFMEIITKEDICDTSSAEVRAMVWRGFESFLASDLSCSYLQQILPNLKKYLYDVNAGVRIAFIRLLISIRNLKKPNFKYNSVVSPAELTRCLENEEFSVGQWLVKLLLPTYYKSSFPETKWVFNFSVLIQKYPHSYRNFFFFSKKCLPFEDAKEIICKLIENLGSYVMRKLKAGNEENSSFHANQTNKAAESTQVENCAYDNPDIVIGILDIIGILWGLHDDRLLKNRDAATSLVNTYMGHVQHFIKYFKDTCVFHTVIHITGNVPISVLTQNSITIQGYCLKMLKMHKEHDLDDTLILIMINALVKWGRVGALLEMIIMWLEASLKPDDVMMVSNPKRVKITDADDPDPLLAIRLLDTIFERTCTRTPTLRKHYDYLLEIFNLMDHVKHLIYGRLLRGMPYTNKLLSDNFLTDCFRRYVNLIPLLRRDDEPLTEEEGERFVDVAQKLRDLFTWMHDDLIPMLHSEQPADLALISFCINEILGLATSMIQIHFINHEEFPRFEQTTSSLLGLADNLHFIKMSSRLTAAMSAYAMVYLPDKNPRVWFTQLPAMLSNITNALIVRAHSADEIQPFKQDISAVGSNIGKILSCYEYCFAKQISIRETTNCAQLMMESLLNCVRAVLSRNFVQDDTILFYDKVSSLPPVAGALISPIIDHGSWSSFFCFAIEKHMASSVKIFLVDIMVIRLLVKCSQIGFRRVVRDLLTPLRRRFDYFKRQSGGNIPESLGVTLTLRTEHNNEDDEGETGTQLCSAAILSRQSDPVSNVVTVGTEPSSRMTDCIAQVTDSIPMDTDEPLPISQRAVSGSQPIERTATNSLPPRGAMDDEQLAKNFLYYADQFLDDIKKIATKPAPSGQKSTIVESQ